MADRLLFAQQRLGVETTNYALESTVNQVQVLVPEGLNKAIDCTGFRYTKGLVHKIQGALTLEMDVCRKVRSGFLVRIPFLHRGIVCWNRCHLWFSNHFNFGSDGEGYCAGWCSDSGGCTC